MKFDVITIGGATEDMSLYTSEGVLVNNKKDLLRQQLIGFEYGAKLLVDRAISAFGGGAANAAVSLSRLGLKTACLAAVGDDARGQEIIKNFKKEKVDTSFIQVKKGEVSGFSPIIIGQGSEHVSFSVRGANANLEISNASLRFLASTKWIYLTSLSGKWKEVLDKVFSVSGPKIAWNPGHIQLSAGKRLLSKYLKETDLLIVNIDEARELIMSDPAYKRKPKKFFDDPKAMAKLINSWGPKTVVITLGAGGASAWYEDEFFRIPAVKIKSNVNTVGVGDAFGSTLVAGLEHYHGNILAALQLAARNSANVTTLEGAQTGLMKWRDINK
ncbi:carbohydrate kinase family protein [Candidatus Falkowbacteria bacterium]|nr:carbohydrate kinase family protein [Candidatus Falkowbacteria bacterium]